ncbi:hypothetical protein F4780DRAFT_48406 [Xylariomycetidae sp. FL0641]|nr:hypothetical protein F4780DRAFT_48406 [Xylariomycetidae sp. FL0641]
MGQNIQGLDLQWRDPEVVSAEASRIADGSQPVTVSDRVFQRFLDLPPEIRTLIYQNVVSEDPTFTHAIHTLDEPWDHEHQEEALMVRTRTRGPGRWTASLWHTSREARAEVERFGPALPTWLVTEPPVSTFDINQGSVERRMSSLPLGPRPYRRGTTFFMVEATAIRVFGTRIAWLTNVMIPSRAFQHMLGLARNSSPGEAGAPFVRMPGLRRLVVCFRRYLNGVFMIEGAYHRTVLEVEVSTQADSEGHERLTATLPEGVHPMLGLMINEAARQTERDVLSLRQAGIEVVWAVVQSGVTMRGELIAGFSDL